MKEAYDPEVPFSASVPKAVQTWARRARWTASSMASAATAAENAVPFTNPRCSFEANVIGSMACARNPSEEGTLRRWADFLGPSKT